MEKGEKGKKGKTVKKVKKVGKVEKVEKGGKSGKRGKGGCTCIMNVAASKVSFGMYNMPASEGSPSMRRTGGPIIWGV